MNTFRRENLMRALKGMFCAAALTACLAPGVRADEYTKQTFLTFSGPVQLPGITLPAGTYQFKLADPESGRRTLQVWDKEGSKLYTTLLTIPDQRMKPSSEPVVMFTEAPGSGAQPIRAWFYPNETYGQEFVYPKEQAMRIARETHTPVLSFDDDATDSSSFKSAKVSRMDETGKMTDIEKSADVAANNTAADAQSASTGASSTTTTADNSAQANTAPQSSTAQSDASLSTPARTADASQSQEPRANAPMPSANRTDPSAPAPVGTSGSTASSAPAPSTNTTSEANRDNMPSAVGTSGSTVNSNSANRTSQAAAGANAAAPRANTTDQSAQPSTAPSSNPAGTLPRTAGSTTLIQLLAGLSIAGAFALRVFRGRVAVSR
jgi:hypothetical protein